MEEKFGNEKGTSDHADLSIKRMEDAYDKVVKLVSWFKTTQLTETDAKKLVSFSTGEVCCDEKINTDQSKAVGLSILSFLDGGNFTSKVPVKQKCQNFDALKKSIKINKTDVLLGSYMLFQSLSMVSERKLALSDSLAFELTVQPASLFDNNQFMRLSNKHKLGTYLKPKTAVVDCITCTAVAKELVIDGGWLLHQIRWQNGETFSEIGSRYVALINHKAAGRRCIVVFEGYASSPKDHEHKRTAHVVGGLEVMIAPERKCPMSKDKFLGNEKNKENFIAYLCELISVNFETTVANDDSDTLIAKKAIDLSASSYVEVIAEDCDVLVLLVHHGASSAGDIFFTSQKGSFCIKDISANLTANERDWLLFLHAFSGCDTASGIYRQSKIALMRKLCAENSDLETIFSRIMSHDPAKDAIISAGMSLLSYIYGDIDKSLLALRISKCHKMAATKMVKPESLPPSPGAARQHILRAYLQYHDWMQLGSMTLPPVEYGWYIKNSKYAPILTKDPVAPSELLKLTLCNCKKGCNSSKCSCKNMGLKCIPACGFCNGASCSNSDPNREIGENDSDNEGS